MCEKKDMIDDKWHLVLILSTVAVRPLTTKD